MKLVAQEVNSVSLFFCFLCLDNNVHKSTSKRKSHSNKVGYLLCIYSAHIYYIMGVWPNESHDLEACGIAQYINNSGINCMVCILWQECALVGQCASGLMSHMILGVLAIHIT